MWHALIQLCVECWVAHGGQRFASDGHATYAPESQESIADPHEWRRSPIAVSVEIYFRLLGSAIEVTE